VPGAMSNGSRAASPPVPGEDERVVRGCVVRSAPLHWCPSGPACDARQSAGHRPRCNHRGKLGM